MRYDFHFRMGDAMFGGYFKTWGVSVVIQKILAFNLLS